MIAKFFKTVIGILLIPIAIGTAKAFYSGIAGISIISGTLNLLERGVLAYLIFHVIILRPVYLYVLAHELVHVIATWLCGGRVVSFSVTPSGGNVVTSKTNFFIELSPYFVPLYTILLGVTFLVMRAMNQSFPHMSLIFIFLVGFTLAFHFVMTSEVLRIEQPDIMKSGFIFSLVLILVGNLVITMAVFSPVFDLSFVSFLKTSMAESVNIYQTAYTNTSEFVNTNKFW
ncbi:MAG: hypothetical protein P9L88_02020 [Candidatus Tantalella remota]|nr:hypothetical protein [Candidatus Tantalella remota]